MGIQTSTLNPLGTPGPQVEALILVGMTVLFLARAFFLISGAVFPLSVLPSPVQAVGLVTPLTWWIEGVRYSLFPGGLTAVGGAGSLFTALTGQGRPDTVLIVVALLTTGSVATLAAIAVFRTSDRRAKDRGLLDQTTGS
jgi:ABC-type polysaccharide/polyol phosphate export permease